MREVATVTVGSWAVAANRAAGGFDVVLVSENLPLRVTCERLSQQINERHTDNHGPRRDLDETLRKLESSGTNASRLQPQRLDAVEAEVSGTPEARRVSERADGTTTHAATATGRPQMCNDGSQP